MHLRSGTTFQWRIATQIACLHTEPRAKWKTRTGDARSIQLFTIEKVSIATTSPLFRFCFLFSSFSCATISTSITMSSYIVARLKKVALDFLPHFVSFFPHTVVRKPALPPAFLPLVVRPSATTGVYRGLRKSLTLPQHPVDRTKPFQQANKKNKLKAPH